MSALNAYPRRILVVACGMTPQVVMETLYALRVGAAEPFAVNEIRLITTTKGCAVAIASLLVAGHFAQFCIDYGFDDIRFDQSHIELIQDAQGRELEDIRTPEDNASAADCITDLVRRLAQDEESALHVSLAGGRKTMSYYTGYALSLFGRAQDRLSHVLVTPEFETEPEFFYPALTSRAITTRGGRYIDASKALVMLATIPFVRMRDTLPARLLGERLSFNEAVRWSNLDQEPVRLELDLRAKTIRASCELVDLSDKELALYAAFVRAAKECEPEFEGTEKNHQLTRAVAEELARIRLTEEPCTDMEGLLRQLEDAGVDPRTISVLRKAIGKKYLQPVIADVKSKLERALGERLARPYLVQVRASINGAKGRVPLYGVALRPAQIRIHD